MWRIAWRASQEHRRDGLDFTPLDPDFFVLGLVFFVLPRTHPQEHIQSHGQSQQYEQQNKPPISKWWWISFLTTSLIFIAIGRASVGDALGNISANTDKMPFASFALFGVALLFYIWVCWAIRRRHINVFNNRISQSSILMP